MHRTALPPTPHCLSREGHERGEQALQRRESEAQGADSRTCRVGSLAVVHATFDEFDIVVAEPPEHCFGALKGTGIVVLIKGHGCFANRFADPCQHRQINGIGGLGCNIWLRESQNKLGRVEQLGCQLLANFHLIFTERGVDARTS